MSDRAQFLAAYNQLIARGWTREAALKELRSVIDSRADYAMHDIDGNPIIIHRAKQGFDMQRRMQEAEDNLADELGLSDTPDEPPKNLGKFQYKDREQELELSEEGLREKPKHDPDREPTWTEVRGMTSFYFVCPRCGSMVPGTGPQLVAPDGKSRPPKEHHENWHKSQLIDWYDDE